MKEGDKNHMIAIFMSCRMLFMNQMKSVSGCDSKDVFIISK